MSPDRHRNCFNFIIAANPNILIRSRAMQLRSYRVCLHHTLPWNAARTNDLQLLDESINLSSAMQLAGYPSMVRTLWQVNDCDAAELSQDVYGWSGRMERNWTFHNLLRCYIGRCVPSNKTRSVRSYQKNKTLLRSSSLDRIYTCRSVDCIILFWLCIDNNINICQFTFL